ncbi:hypothetical protein NPIL_589391 [Nephila pilipes]|uniref:Uncharacterized protein n=1 Tax=Nephila pilipes TaxID=299642 RepID=A0A8X6PDM0_NEPPI|nr:hypothetical protein NPIL_589391 [Nephila pilipes]
MVCKTFSELDGRLRHLPADPIVTGWSLDYSLHNSRTAGEGNNHFFNSLHSADADLFSPNYEGRNVVYGGRYRIFGTRKLHIDDKILIQSSDDTLFDA